MKKTILVCLLFTCGLLLNAQTVVIEETINKQDSSIKKQSKIAFGFMFELTFLGGLNEKGLKGTLDNSFGINFLLNSKYKLSKNLSLVAQYGYNYESYSFKKSDTNTTFPTPVNNNLNNRFLIHALSLSIGARIKLNEKFYTEIGAMSKLHLSKIYNYEAKDVNGNFTDVYIHELDYIKDFNHDAYLRLGYKTFNFVAYYRLNDMFKPTSYAPVVYELPRLRLGIALGL